MVHYLSLGGVSAALTFGVVAVVGVLLGVGSVLAMGCTVGHGFSGIATLALGSIVAILAIVAGSWSMLKLETQWGQESPASCG